MWNSLMSFRRLPSSFCLWLTKNTARPRRPRIITRRSRPCSETKCIPFMTVSTLPSLTNERKELGLTRHRKHQTPQCLFFVTEPRPSGLNVDPPRGPTPILPARLFLSGVMGVFPALRFPVCMALVSDVEARRAGCDGREPTCRANI